MNAPCAPSQLIHLAVSIFGKQWYRRAKTAVSEILSGLCYNSENGDPPSPKHKHKVLLPLEFFFLRFSSFIHKRPRERGRCPGRERSRPPAGSPTWDSSQDPGVTPATTESPRRPCTGTSKLASPPPCAHPPPLFRPLRPPGRQVP